MSERSDPTFDPLVTSDLPLVARWLVQPHVQRWWHTVGTAADLREKYAARIRGADPTEVFLIVVDAHPIGLIQRYRIANHSSWDRAVAGTGIELKASAGIDYLIGEPKSLRKGLGKAAIRGFTDRLFDEYREVDVVIAAPQVANVASCRALAGAGYCLRWVGRLESEDPSDAGQAALYVQDRS